MIISFNPGDKNGLKSSINNIDRAKEKFSTETGFERGKTAEISKVYRLIIVTNVLER